MTIADVSKAAGVGVATVSRALAPEPRRDVSAETRERVMRAADALGYRTSMPARALRSGRHHAVSIIVPDSGWGWWEQCARSVSSSAAEEGFQVLVHPVAGRPGAWHRQ